MTPFEQGYYTFMKVAMGQQMLGGGGTDLAPKRQQALAGPGPDAPKPAPKRQKALPAPTQSAAVASSQRAQARAPTPAPVARPAPKAAPAAIAKAVPPSAPARPRRTGGADAKQELDMMLGSMHAVDMNPNPMNRDVYRRMNAGQGTFSRTPRGSSVWQDRELAYKKNTAGDWEMSRGQRPKSMGPPRIEF